MNFNKVNALCQRAAQNFFALALILVASRNLTAQDLSELLLVRSLIGLYPLLDFGTYQILAARLSKYLYMRKYYQIGVPWARHVVFSLALTRSLSAIVIFGVALIFFINLGALQSLNYIDVVLILISIVCLICSYYLECIFESLGRVSIVLNLRTVNAAIVFLITTCLVLLDYGSKSLIYATVISSLFSLKILHYFYPLKTKFHLMKNNFYYLRLFKINFVYIKSKFLIASLVGGVGLMAIIPSVAINASPINLAKFGLLFNLVIGVFGLISVISNYSLVPYKIIIESKDSHRLFNVVTRNILLSSTLLVFGVLLAVITLKNGCFGVVGDLISNSSIFFMGISIFLLNIANHISVLFKAKVVEINSESSVLATCLCILIAFCSVEEYDESGPAFGFLIYSIIIFINCIYRFLNKVSFHDLLSKKLIF